MSEVPRFQRIGQGEKSDIGDPRCLDAAKILKESGNDDLANHIFKKGWENNPSEERERIQRQMQYSAGRLINPLKQIENKGRLPFELDPYEVIRDLRILLASAEDYLYRVCGQTFEEQTEMLKENERKKY